MFWLWPWPWPRAQTLWWGFHNGRLPKSQFRTRKVAPVGLPPCDTELPPPHPGTGPDPGKSGEKRPKNDPSQSQTVPRGLQAGPVMLCGQLYMLGTPPGPHRTPLCSLRRPLCHVLGHFGLRLCPAGCARRWNQTLAVSWAGRPESRFQWHFPPRVTPLRLVLKRRSWSSFSGRPVWTAHPQTEQFAIWVYSSLERGGSLIGPYPSLG